MTDDTRDTMEEYWDFVFQLAHDPERQTAFERDFDVALAAQPLSPATRQHVRRLGPTQLETHLHTVASRTCTNMHHRPVAAAWSLPAQAKAAATQSTGKTLVFVGLGIKAVGHLTRDAQFWLERADTVFGLGESPVLERLLGARATTLRTFDDLYQEGRERADTYDRMVERILQSLDHASVVCVAFYGHPLVLVDATIQAVARARSQGHRVVVVPGISALDCLFVDLGLDIGTFGLQTYDATAFLLRRPTIDPSTPLVLWQPAEVGEGTWSATGPDERHVAMLAQLLAERYGAEHPVGVYTASVFAPMPHLLRVTTLRELHTLTLTSAALLVVPPRETPVYDRELAARLDVLAPDARDDDQDGK